MKVHGQRTLAAAVLSQWFAFGRRQWVPEMYMKYMGMGC